LELALISQNADADEITFFRGTLQCTLREESIGWVKLMFI
jgi:hypothetical protein